MLKPKFIGQELNRWLVHFMSKEIKKDPKESEQ